MASIRRPATPRRSRSISPSARLANSSVSSSTIPPTRKSATIPSLIADRARRHGKSKPSSSRRPASAGGELFWSAADRGQNERQSRRQKLIFACSISNPTAAIFFSTTPGPCATCRARCGSRRQAPPCGLLSATARAFSTSKAPSAEPLPNGGSGGAEARYLETVVFAQHQLMETNRWAMENLPWDLYLAYTPFPDEAEHVWRGYLDSTLARLSVATSPSNSGRFWKESIAARTSISACFWPNVRRERIFRPDLRSRHAGH